MGLKILGADEAMEDKDLTKNGYNYLCELNSKSTKNVNEKISNNIQRDKMGLKILRI
jgi:hypothetical protein